MMKVTLIATLLLFSVEAAFSQDERGVEEAHGLAQGIKAPMFTALDADSALYSLEESLKSGPVVLIFYRGHWCPYCNRHLEQIQDSLDLIYAKGASVVAVSPQNPYEVSFTPESRQTFMYNSVLNANLKKSQSDDSQRLPIPATYIINREGIIAWRQFDPNYKNRSTVKDILVAIAGLQGNH